MGMRIESTTAEKPADARLAAFVWERLLDRMQSTRAPACSEAHLARVRNAIALGQFHVNARSLADRLIERLLQP
jgi:hypothetical protein